MTQVLVCSLTGRSKICLPVAMAIASASARLVLPIPPADAVTVRYDLM
jgi:hypothetical protein